VADYEDEQLEALKRWWHENARSIIIGLVVAIIGVSGWQGWQWHTDRQSEGAARFYQQAAAEMPMGDTEIVVDAARTLTSDYRRTNYAALGALAAARVLVRDLDYAGAVVWLEWVVDNAREDSIRAIARVRLARVLGELGETDRALALLDEQIAPGWAAMHHEVRGDLLAATGDLAAAAEAYEAALAADGRLSERQLVELKLNRARAGGESVGDISDS